MVAHSGESPGAMPRLVKSEKVKTQSAWTTIQNKTTRDTNCLGSFTVGL